MSKDEIYERIRQTLETNFEIAPERITPEARLMEDLELDSIDAIDMAVQIQDMTNVRVEEEQLKNLRTVEDTVLLVLKLLEKNG